MTTRDQSIQQAFALAQEQYAALGVNVQQALDRLVRIPISMHCWQGDDVGGFENAGQELGGGLAVTGNYPGKARTPAELRADVEKSLSLIPGKHRLSLHASYAETGGRRVDRNQFQTCHFQGWIEWAKSIGIKLDFNSTFFAHPKAADGMTLAHADEGIRRFWVEHGALCRQIGADIGRTLESPCVTNHWIPDGMKDVTIDRTAPRQRLIRSLDEMFAAPADTKWNLDSIEAKLFGIGSETYVVGSHEFYLGYAVKNEKMLTLDAGHFHPTETIADKLSSILLFVPEVLLHVSRGIRWDSDHVVILNDDLRAIAEELVRGQLLGRVHIGLDYFDASINRVAAWVIGMRAMLKALLAALLEPTDKLRQLEQSGDYTARLALVEEVKTLPMPAVWEYYCQTQNVPVGMAWVQDVKSYEAAVTSKRK